MEVNQQIVKSVLKFLGIVFIACGSVLFVYYSLFTFEPSGTPFFATYLINLPLFIPPILIISVGIALNKVSTAL